MHSKKASTKGYKAVPSFPDFSGTFSGKRTSPNSDQQVALSVGSDVTATLILNNILPHFIQKGYEPIVYLPKERITHRMRSEGAFGHTAENYRFAERKLTNKLVYKFLEARDPKVTNTGQLIPSLNYTPKQLGQLYGVKVIDVESVNDSDLVQSWAENESLVGHISVRCYQIFKKNAINAFTDKSFNNSKGFFWNIHPGPLPKYRGFFHPPIAVYNNDQEYSWTLHEVLYDKKLPRCGIDAGPMIGRATQKIVKGESPIKLYTEFADSASKLIVDSFEMIRNGRRPHYQPKKQDMEEGDYYNYDQLYLLEKKLVQPVLEKLGYYKLDFTDQIKLINDSHFVSNVRNVLKVIQPDFEYIRNFILEKFTLESSEERETLSPLLDKAITDWLIFHREPSI